MDMAFAHRAAPGQSATYVVRVVRAACSGVAVALLAGCDPGAPPVRIENHCDVPIHVSYEVVVLEEPQDPDSPPRIAAYLVGDAVIEVPAGASSTLKPETQDGSLVIRGSDGEWITVAPLDNEAPAGSDVGFIRDGVFVVDGVLCAQLDDRVSGRE
jgi:hypothetical protein